MTGTPPPPPARTPEELARDQLVRELRALETPELLALCLRGRNRPDRLRLYLSILRGRAGTRAQLASCLVCFDLARLGDGVAQQEFLALAPTIEVLSHDQRMVDDLLGSDDYLQRTWSECRATLEGGDQRELDGSLNLEGSDLIGELDLLSDEEIDLDLEVEEPADARAERARAEFAGVLAKQLAQDSNQGIFASSGFETASSRDLDRMDAFLNQALSYADLVSTARGMASLGHLFLATHLRMKTLFGKRNQRRAQAVRTGLVRLPADLEAVEHAAAVFELEGGAAMLGFEKVLELLLDFLAYCHQTRQDPRAAATVDAYVDAERMPAPVLLTGEQRRRRG